MLALRQRLSSRLVLVCGLWLVIGCEPSPDEPGTGVPNQSQGATELSPSVVEIHDKGVALMGQFDYVKAHDVFAQLVNVRPNWLDAKVDLAIAKLNRRQDTDVEDSESLLDEVIEADANNLRAKYCRAILSLYAAQPEKAFDLFRDVAEADPSDAYAIYYSGQCLLDSRQYEPALEYFERAQHADPYLRSAYYGAFQALQRLKRVKEAKAELEVFQKLADNPQARAAEIKYSRMGPKAETRSIASAGGDLTPPTGPLFGEIEAIALEDAAWAPREDAAVAGATVSDLNGDQSLDIFLTSATAGEADSKNLVLVRDGEAWVAKPGHPLAKVAYVNAALWGDYDNDGFVDVYLCRRGPNQLWRQVAAGDWEDVTESTNTSAGDFDTADGAMFDADHDGDLDIFVANRNGPNELLNNNLDGTFRAIGAAQGIAGGDARSVGVVIADLDSDRDADLVVLNEGAKHQVFLNDRLWNYSAATGADEFEGAGALSVVAADTNADGQVELVTTSESGIRIWSIVADGTWNVKELRCEHFDYGAGPIAVQDMNGDGRLDLIASSATGWMVIDCFADLTSVLHAQSADAGVDWALANFGGGRGYSILTPDGGKPKIATPGAGRFQFADVEFTGKESKADQMRSNASGIGIKAAARVGGHWTALQTFRDQSGPGQSRQPIAVGLREQRAIDFVKLLWPDGLFQTELSLSAGAVHRIEETQRQVSSCPVVFAWNGETHEFVSDVLGVGGLGFNGGRGEYHPPRPWENLVLPAGLLRRTDEKLFRIKIGEPMEEACYLDAVRLVEYRLPSGWQMTLDERQAVSEPFATGDPIFYRQLLNPSRAVDSEGRNVLQAVRTADGRPMEPGKRDRRFLAHCRPFAVTLTFDVALDELPGRPVLVIDGWVEYPYSQTMFAAWQAGAPYHAPSLEARPVGGEWQMIYPKFGYPAGMPRQMALPIELEDLPEGTVELRISSSMEIYWDCMFIAVEEACDDVHKSVCRSVSAAVQRVGFPKRTNREYRRPQYDYTDRADFWDTRHAPGFYTNFGDALPLLADVDDAVAIIGPGEEVELQFEPNQADAISGERGGSGHQSVFVLECHGWCKDMDLYTEHGESLGPMPRREHVERDEASEQRRGELMQRHNQRFEAGRPAS